MSLPKFNPDPDTHTTYEWVPAGEVRPGAVILGEDGIAVKITAVRVVRPHGVVSLYRDPTIGECEAFLREHDADLRATWVQSSVPDSHVLVAVPPQDGLNLAY